MLFLLKMGAYRRDFDKTKYRSFSMQIMNFQESIMKFGIKFEILWQKKYLISNNGKPVQTTISINKTTACLRRPMLSLPKPIPIQSVLYKTTTCLT